MIWLEQNAPQKKEDIVPCRIVFEMVTDPQKKLN